MATIKWIRRRFWGLAVGTLVTLLTVVAYLGGSTDILVNGYHDWFFRHVNRIEVDDRIVMIDINDLALQRIHRWPWPRRMQADLVRVLSECGARSILLDLVYAEPMPGYIEHPSLEADARIDDEGELLGSISLNDAVFEDDELADAIATAGNVHVGMFFRLYPPDQRPWETAAQALALLDQDPQISYEAFAQELSQKPNQQSERYFTRMRIEHALTTNLGLSTAELAKQLSLPVGTVDLHFTVAKESAAIRLVRTILANEPNLTFAEIFARVFPDLPADIYTPERKNLVRAYRYAKTAPLVYRHALPVAEDVLSGIANGGGLQLPIGPVANAADRVGFVTFDKDADGILRHVPLIANVEGHIVPQIGFSLACDLLDIDLTSVQTFDKSRMLVMWDRTGRNSWEIPLDPRGWMLLNWHVNRETPTWEKSFDHLPVARVMEVAINRRNIRDNIKRIALKRAKAVELMYDQAESAYLDYEAMVSDLNSLKRDLSHQRTEATRANLQDQIKDLSARINKIEEAALANVARLAQQSEGLEPQDDYERRVFPRLRSLNSELVEGKLTERIEQNNAKLQARNDELLAELKNRLSGKLCFVGHTATAQADMVNTPVYESMPGVMAHANLVNTLLQNRIPTVASPKINVLVIIVCGAIVTLLTCSRGPVITFLSVLAIMATCLFASALLVWQSGPFVAVIVPVCSIFVTWALITLYRQLTEERQRRSFARALSRNTSPAIARAIADRIDDLDLAPQPADVTCYFSDLEGFTTISERLGADETKTILNSYLGAMGRVLVEHKGINKFMGDGIFAFFNAPIWPVTDHVVVGCEAVLKTVQELDRLREREAGGRFAEEFKKLNMRVGLHSGPLFVGEFGSGEQTDYTCIGDTVNLAARLESANKAFGTRLMVSGACRDIVADRYEFRYLGSLIVKGKARAVPVYEMLGRSGDVAAERLEYAELFGNAVEKFQNRSWSDARRLFEQCREKQPSDIATKLYANAIERFEEAPPPEDWSQAIELTTK